MSGESSAQESVSNARRLLHYTMKIKDRSAARHFFCDILGMKILRHLEMITSCTAQCNGDFDSPWSKTMAGYGDEHSYFVFELNYNYFVEGYTYGNDYSSVTIRHRQAVSNARQFLDKKCIVKDDTKSVIVLSPDGHRFILIDEDVCSGEDPVQCLSVNVSNLQKSIEFYTGLLEMKINQLEVDNKHVKLYYGSTMSNNQMKVKTKSGFLVDNQCQLELIELSEPIERGNGYGRKAFSCPTNDIEVIERLTENKGFTVVIPAMELGGTSEFDREKVVIIADPDEHEICFVGEENYFKACETDPDVEIKFKKGLETTPDDIDKYLTNEYESAQ